MTAFAALTMCSVPGCPNLCATPGLCTPHRREKATQRGATGWDRQARTRAYLADHPLCAICEGHPPTVVDHATPLSRGGADTPDNWQALCKECHDRKSQYEREQG